MQKIIAGVRLAWSSARAYRYSYSYEVVWNPWPAMELLAYRYLKR